ncbi:MAG: polyprenyl synthetase family protein [Syntrophomonadaceae bacterium]|nr:polyprenyl synthetase family protein [Syntrophomonadaceae bacterium]
MHFPFPADKIINRLKETLQDSQDMNDYIDYLLNKPGKMLRSRLVHLSANLYPSQESLVIDVAVAIELIHLASLVHDDIIDNSNLRRGQESINSKWNNKVAVLLGDYLFAAAFNIINRQGLPAVMETVTETIKIMCIGEIQQLYLTNRLDITRTAYLEKIYRKTACLFASSCQVGGLISSMPQRQIGIIQNYGLHLGNAYQIIDDVLDFVSHPGLLGKPAGNDLLEGNINLPVIIALEDPIYGPELKPLLQDQITISMNLKKIIRILTESYALDMAIGEARKYLNQARQMLQQLPSGEARDDLFTLSDYLLNNYLQAGISSDYQKNIPECKVWM